MKDRKLKITVTTNKPSIKTLEILAIEIINYYNKDNDTKVA